MASCCQRDSEEEESACTHLDVPVHGETGRAFDQAPDLGAAEVFGDGRKLAHVDVARHDAVGLHLARVDVENLEAAVLVGERDLHVHLETARAKEGLVDHVKSVRHADDENVVELVDSVHLRAHGRRERPG